MLAIISFMTSIFLLGFLGWTTIHFLGFEIAYAILFIIVFLWGLGQKFYTDNKFKMILQILGVAKK